MKKRQKIKIILKGETKKKQVKAFKKAQDTKVKKQEAMQLMELQKLESKRSARYCDVIQDIRRHGITERVPTGNTQERLRKDGDGLEKTPVLRTRRIKTMPVRVLIIEGDPQNGKGIISKCSMKNLAETYPRGTKVRWAGGTSLTLAKICKHFDIEKASAEKEARRKKALA